MQWQNGGQGEKPDNLGSAPKRHLTMKRNSEKFNLTLSYVPFINVRNEFTAYYQQLNSDFPKSKTFCA